uniref:F-box domain-containing protein n=1 Tax=Steinernema glaseri TaxID=37863 RepID=A0A1I8A2F3_9BILA
MRIRSRPTPGMDDVPVAFYEDLIRTLNFDTYYQCSTLSGRIGSVMQRHKPFTVWVSISDEIYISVQGNGKSGPCGDVTSILKDAKNINRFVVTLLWTTMDDRIYMDEKDPAGRVSEEDFEILMSTLFHRVPNRHVDFTDTNEELINPEAQFATFNKFKKYLINCHLLICHFEQFNGTVKQFYDWIPEFLRLSPSLKTVYTRDSELWPPGSIESILTFLGNPSSEEMAYRGTKEFALELISRWRELPLQKLPVETALELHKFHFNLEKWIGNLLDAFTFVEIDAPFLGKRLDRIIRENERYKRFYEGWEENWWDRWTVGGKYEGVPFDEEKFEQEMRKKRYFKLEHPNSSDHYLVIRFTSYSVFDIQWENYGKFKEFTMREIFDKAMSCEIYFL